MKQLPILLISFLFLNVLLSCNNDLMIERDLSQLDQNINIESDDSILLSAHCYGCLPSLDVYHDFSFDEFVIA